VTYPKDINQIDSYTIKINANE